MHLLDWGWVKVMFFSMYDLPALKGMSESERRRIVRAALTKYDKEWLRRHESRTHVAPIVVSIVVFIASFIGLLLLAGYSADGWKVGICIIVASACLSFLAFYYIAGWCLRHDDRLQDAVQIYLNLDHKGSGTITGRRIRNNTPDKGIATLNKASLKSPYDLPELRGRNSAEKKRIVHAALKKCDKWWLSQTFLLTVVVPFGFALISFYVSASFWEKTWPEYWFIGDAVVCLFLSFEVAARGRRWMLNNGRLNGRLSKAVQTYLAHEASLQSRSG